MSIVEQAMHRMDIAQPANGQEAHHAFEREQDSQSFFSLRVVVLLGLAVGASLVVAVMLFIGKIPNGMPSGTPVSPMDKDASQSASGNIVPQASLAISEKVSTKPAPANSAIAKSQQDARRGMETDVRLLVTLWAEAWSRRDAAAYLACYAADFSVPDGMSRAAWEAQRKLRITKPRSIKVALNQVEVSIDGDGIALVRFVQDFRADSYREAGTKKELRLKNENGHWRIVSEKII